MARIPEDTIHAIRDRVDIVDVVGRVVGLKKAGRNWKGLCPFHDEKTPSFNVSPDRGTYHCFGCGEGGNVFGFVMQHEGLTFPEAVRSLASDVGIEVPESGGSDGQAGFAEQIFKANRVAQDLYRRLLLAEEGAPARAYLVERGLDRGISEHHGIGFAPDRWDTVVTALQHAGIDAEVGEKAGLIKKRESSGHFDMLRGRITFPIQDPRGRILGFGGRAISPDQEPKYLNSPESPVFHKRQAFYGFPMALEPIRKRDRVVVIEGYFDAIALARAGVGEGVATCGTALTEEHARNLRRRTRHVVLLFDGDDAGQRAMLRGLEVLLPHDLRVSAVALPSGQDPDDLLRSEGPEALAARIDTAAPALDVAIRRAIDGGVSTPWERADAVAAVVPLLTLVPDAVERSEFGRRLAMATGVQPTDVEAAIRKARAGEDPTEAIASRPRQRGPEHRHYESALQALIAHPALAEEAGDFVELAPEPALAAVAAAVVTGVPASELLDRLEGEPRQLLSQLAARETRGLEDPEVARRAFVDTLAKVRGIAAERERKALTQALHEDPSLLDRKNTELLNKRQRIPAV